ncbi:hypothetical protein [Acidimangrovimonas sediminis]|uniref:hypothetical protein n=1 Tax=Acidimangrovimonas sediminis TaxID=2056283 RepID=UPI000C7FC7EF|nr:hypothetical protein [Acidimangrovimonas sediminis]
MSRSDQATWTTRRDEIRERAVIEVAKHVRRHGLGLHEVVSLADDGHALDQTETLIGEADRAFPDPEILKRALTEVLGCLENLSIARVDELSREGGGPRDIFAAVDWHGARLADLAMRYGPVLAPATGGARR